MRGLIPFSGNFDRRIAAPLDDMRVATKADLLLPASWAAGDGIVYTWLGMFAVVYNDTENNGGYLLKSADYTQETSWLKIGASIDLTDYVTYTEGASQYVQKLGVSYSASGVTLDENYPEFTITDATAFRIMVTSTVVGGNVAFGTETDGACFIITASDESLQFTIDGTDYPLTSQVVALFTNGTWEVYEIDTATPIDPSGSQVQAITDEGTFDGDKAIFSALTGASINDKILVDHEIDKAFNCIYQIVGITATTSIAIRLFLGESLLSVRVEGGGLYENTFDGVSISTCTFKLLGQGGGAEVTADSVDNAIGGYTTVTTIEDSEKIVIKGKKLITLGSIKTLLASLFVKGADLFRNGKIKSELLPEISSDVIELLEVATALEDVQGMVAGDKAYYTDDKKIYTYSGTAWGTPETPSADKLYLSKADTITYKWNGTDLVATTSPLPFATLGQAVAGTSFVSVITPYAGLYAFKNWIENITFSGFTTAVKTIKGAINELKTRIDGKMTESEFVGVGATKYVKNATNAQWAAIADNAEWANNSSNADNATNAYNAEQAYKDHNGNIIDEEYVHVVAGKGLSTNDYTTDEKNKLAGINNHYRGTHLSLAALETAVPVGNEGDEAIVDAGAGQDPKKYIWDNSDGAWKLGSGTSVTVDQSINSGSTNAVAGGAVYNALGGKVDTIAGKALSTNDLTDTLKSHYDAAYTDKHTHSNKTVLDATEEAFTTALKALYAKEIMPLVCSDELSDLTASASVSKLRFVIPGSYTLTDIFAELNAAPTGSAMTIDVKKNGTSIFSTPITIDANELTSRTAATPYILTGPISFSLANNDYVEVFVTVVGSTIAGRGLKVYLITTKS